MKKLLTSYPILLFFLGIYSLQSQNLNIISTGQTGTSGTNWSITGNTLNVASSGTADVHPNVISNHLNNVGNLTVVLPGQSNQIRQCSIDGTITYTGSATRTLTFLIANDIFLTSLNQSITATGSGALNVVLRAASSGGIPNNGRISIRQNNTINTNGGHLWIGGGSGNVTWNGLTVGNDVARTWTDNTPGLWIENSTLNTNGGNVYLAGLSFNSSANSGENYGVRMVNSDISSVSGNIEINGELDGRYSIGNGTRIESTTTTATSITTTTGSISIRGTGSDNSPNDNGFRFGAVITGSSSTAKTIISTTSGNIQIEGNAYFAATVNDKEGLAIGGATEIISRSGNITIRGTNSLESSGQYCNSIRFDPRNESNSIRVGFDGTNSYTGNILIEGNSIYQRYLHSSTGSIAVQTTGTLTIQPTGNAFTYMRADDAGGTLTYDNDWNFGTTLSSFTLGKSTNTTDLTFANVLSPAGPITIYGGNININENLNTSAGASSGNVLLKGTGDIVLAASKSITTSGGSAILWANSDNGTANGSIALRNGSSIVTGSNTVAGGHVWIGGGSNGTTWNGLSVGNGYAVPGTLFTPSNTGTDIAAGIYLERNSITSFGGNIKIAGDGAASARGIVSYGNTININSGSGKIEMDGQVTSTAAGNRGGILFGLHDNAIASTVNISSSSTSGDAITITGVGRGTEDAIGLSGTLNITASGGGNIVMNGNALGTGRSIVAGNFYHGIINVFANSGNITLNGNTKAVQVATAINLGGQTSGPSKINIGQGGSILSSSSNVVLTADNIALAAGGIAVNTSGTVTIEPSSNSFASALTYPITNLSIANTINGLTLGKASNTANITVSSAQSIAGPINIYGGTITLNANLTTTNNGDISLYTDNPLGGLSSARTLTASGAFKYIPRGTTFSADVIYPIANLTATCTGLTIGNVTNDKNITVNADVIGGAGIELYGNNVAINSNLTTTGSSTIMHLKGNTTIAAGKTITSGGNFTHDGNLIFKSDATGTAAFGSLGGTFNRVSGLATIERYIPAKRAWRLLNAPLKGATNTTVPANWQGVNGEGLLLFSPATYQSQTMTGYTLGGGMPNIWKYNNGWQAIPNLTNENLFTSTGTNGFLVFATGHFNSTNVALGEAATTLKPQGQLITGAVSNSIIGNQYNLVANPYASALNTEAMVLANSGSKVWMVDPSLGKVGGYFTYDGTNWAPTTPSATDKNIQSGQAFFVRTASNSTFSIAESHKISGSSNSWFSRIANSPADKIRVLLYKQNNSEWQLADGILAVNSSSGNNEVDHTDTGKMSNFDENLMFSNGTSNLAIEYRGLPTASTAQSMRLTGTTVQPYLLKVKAESYTNTNLQPFIQDTQTGTVTPIPTDGSEVVLPFTGVVANSTNPDSRFRIIYQSALSTNDKDILSVGVYPNPVDAGVFTVLLKENTTSASYTLTNLLGQQVQEGKLMQLSNSVNVTSLQIGIYIIQVKQEGKTFTRKLIIK